MSAPELTIQEDNDVVHIVAPDPNQVIAEKCDFDNNVYEPLHSCNKFLLRREFAERNQSTTNNDGNENNDMYPTLNDPDFSLKIANKREFRDTMYDGDVHDVEARANELAQMEFELTPHQMFVKNFLSSRTPYNSLLLFHGLGTGKTCSAIGICEEHRDYIRQTGDMKKILIVASPNVQDNFRLQLFNESTMTNLNGEWFIKSCIGNKLIREINPTKTKNVSKERTVLQINRIINESYEFMGYREFTNYIEKKQMIGIRIDDDVTSPKQIARMKRNLKSEFDDRLLCIDEVHNIRNADDVGNKRTANQLMFLIKSTTRMKLLLLSGTPMFNNYKEIVWLINLMNMNDGRGLIKVSDVFNANGEFQESDEEEETESGRDVLARKTAGYVSFVRGENPYTFPYRVYPDLFSPDNTFSVIPLQKNSIVGGEVVQNKVNTITKSNIYVTRLGEYQEGVYNNMIQDLVSDMASGRTHTKKSGDDEDDGDEEGSGTKGTVRIGYTRLQDPLQCLNMTFPLNDMTGLDADDTTVDANKVENVLARHAAVAKDAIGTRGLKSTMDYVDERTESNYMKGQFAYKTWIQQSKEHKNFLAPDNVGRYSGKLKQVCDSILESVGVVLVYSQYLDGGLIPIALALEEMGIARYGTKDKSLFKTPPAAKPFLVGANPPRQAKYIMITGDKRISPGNAAEIAAATKDENVYGDHVKVVLVSMAGSEGVDLKFIRQVHIVEPWYNMSRIDQIVGRAVRHNSHKLLPFRERNVQIFMYGSAVRDETQETADMYVYRNAEAKAVQIGVVTRALKEFSVDCFLNHSQTNFSADKMDQSVEQLLSSGKVIPDFVVGDQANTTLTDFMEDGNYKCYSKTESSELIEEDLNNSTYDERFILLNTDKIIQKIRGLFRENHFYRKDDLFARLMHIKKYPIAQVYAALTLLVDTDTEYITDSYGRSGRLVNLGEYYLFQPIELMDKHITLFERTVPLQFKHDRLKIKMDLAPTLDDNLMRAASQSQNATDADAKIDDADTQVVEDGGVTVNAISAPSAISAAHASIINGDEIVTRLDTEYKLAKEVYDTATNMKRGERDIYKYFGSAMLRLVNNEIMTKYDAFNILMDHLMGHLQMVHKITLLHYVFDGVMTEPNIDMKNRIKQWFVSRQIETTGDYPVIGMAFYDTSLKKGGGAIYYVLSTSDNGASTSTVKSWHPAQTEDVKDLTNHIMENNAVISDDVAHLFGFIGDDMKNANIIFKLKEFSNKRSKGHRCGEMKKEFKLDILRKLISEEVLDKLKYISPKMDKTLDPPQRISYYVMHETCVFVEFILRHYDSTKKDGKRWFFDYEDQHMFRDVLKV